MKVYAVKVGDVEGNAFELGDFDGVCGLNEAGMCVASDIIYLTRAEWEELKAVGDAYFDEVASVSPQKADA